MDKPKYSAPLIINFSSHKVPEFKELKNKEWVYYGDKNDYPDYLLRQYNRCSKHASIINSKANYIYGNGWGISNKYIKISDKAILNNLLSAVEYGEKIPKLTKKIILDYEIFGGFALEITWDKRGNKIASIKHIDFTRIRSNKDNTKFFYTSEWVKKTGDKIYPKENPQNNEDFKQYDAYNEEERSGSQILYFKRYCPNLDVYPLPEYVSANVAIETDIEISNYHYNNLKNGFTATVLISFNNGTPSDEEQQKIEKQIKEKLSGSDNAGKFILSFGDGKDKSAEITTLTMSDAHNQFENLRKDITQEIFIGHSITSPMLFGVRTEGQLGGRSEIIEANELFQNGYVKGRQNIFNDLFNDILRINGFNGEINLTRTEPIGIDYFGNNNLFSILTMEEKREHAGLPPLKSNEQITSNQQIFYSKQDEPKYFDVSLISKFGKDRNKYRIIKTSSLKERDFEFLKKEEENIRMSFEEVLSVDLKSLDRSVLDLLNKEPNTPIEDISSAIGVSKQKIKQSISRLLSKKLIEKYKDETLESLAYEPTKKGENALEEKEAKTINIFLKYSYDWRNEVPTSKRDTSKHPSREFCKDIMSQNRLYSLDEIISLSSEVGYNVFEHTGGFWNNNGVIEPHCRHEWQQHVVEEIE